MSRLAQLLRFVEDEPHDPFNLYALALEYLKLNDDKATQYFEILVTQHERYVPTYYTFGKLQQANKAYTRAKELFLKGIEEAMKVDDKKTTQELRNALSELEFEMDE